MTLTAAGIAAYLPPQSTSVPAWMLRAVPLTQEGSLPENLRGGAELELDDRRKERNEDEHGRALKYIGRI